MAAEQWNVSENIFFPAFSLCSGIKIIKNKLYASVQIQKKWKKRLEKTLWTKLNSLYDFF